MAAGPHWSLSEDRMTLTIAFPTSPPTAIALGAAEVDEMLAGVAVLRGAMAEQVPDSLEPSFVAHAVPEPAWRVSNSPAGPLLALRHPGFGWLSWLLPSPYALQIAGWLLRMGTDPRMAPLSPTAAAPPEPPLEPPPSQTGPSAPSSGSSSSGDADGASPPPPPPPIDETK